MYFRVLWVFLFVTASAVFLPRVASAGYFEVSSGFSFNRSNYGEGNYSWTRKWGASFGYHLTEFGEIELGFQDIVDRTVITNYEDTTFHDQVLSVNWVQSMTGRNAPLQPYFKFGVGQLNRDATGNYAMGGSPPAIVDQLTAIAGAGLKIYLTKAFGIRAEGTSYLTGGVLSTWQDNVAVTFGLSIYM